MCKELRSECTENVYKIIFVLAAVYKYSIFVYLQCNVAEMMTLEFIVMVCANTFFFKLRHSPIRSNMIKRVTNNFHCDDGGEFHLIYARKSFERVSKKEFSIM